MTIGIPSWASRLRGRRTAVAAAVIVAVAVAITLVGATVGSGPAKARSLGQAKNFDLSVLGRPGQHPSLESMTSGATLMMQRSR